MTAEDTEVLQDSIPPASLHVDLPPDGDEKEGDDALSPVLEEEEPWEVQRRKIPLRVVDEWFDFEHFKNRYSENDGLAIIEVLHGHSQIAQEVSKETMRRARGKKDIRVPTPTPKPTIDSDSCWIHRIRIQSPQLIRLLSRLTGHRDKWSIDNPRTFFAPFRAFYYYLPQLKESLRILEAKWANAEAHVHPAPSQPPANQDPAQKDVKPKRRREGKRRDSYSSSSSSNSDDDDAAATHGDSGPMEPDIAVSGDLVDSSTTLAHLGKFIEFIDKHITPRWHRAAGTSQRKFRFADLWMAFQPGELLYSPLSSDSAQNSDMVHGSGPKMYQTAWRLYSLVLGSVRDDRLDDTQKVSKRDLDVHAYYIDYDGTSYVPVRYTHVIKDYEGERDITSLDIYPLRFVKDAEKIKETLHQQGSWFRRVITEKHLFYDGWTLTHGPTGIVSDSKDPPPVEHIDGDVIIDFVEGYKSEPSLGPGPSSWSQGLRDFDDSDWPVGDDDLWIVHWKPIGNTSRLEGFAEIREKTQRGEWYVLETRGLPLPFLAEACQGEANTVKQVLRSNEKRAAKRPSNSPGAQRRKARQESG